MSRPSKEIDESTEERIAKISARQAIVIAIITALAGILGAAIQKYSTASLKESNDTKSYSSWAGSWETDTETYKYLRIEFNQSNGEVKGTYRIPSQISGLPAGRIEGKTTNNVLIGRWTENLADRDIAGEVVFVLFDGGRAFLGAYTRDREGNREKHVWSGKKIE